jgi:hypothetical protein
MPNPAETDSHTHATVTQGLWAITVAIELQSQKSLYHVHTDSVKALLFYQTHLI